MTDSSADERRIPDPSALIFDLDGTLVDTVETRIEAWTRAFEEFGIPVDREHVSTLIGADGRRLAREVAAAAGRPLADGGDEDLDRRAGEIFTELNVHPRPLPGVARLLRALDAASVPWSIATSSRADQVQTSVAAISLDRPPRIVDGSHVEHAKPAPDLLLRAAEELGLATARCWYVGDAVWDMQAAKAARMPAVAIATGSASGRALLEAGADLAFDTMEPVLPELIRRGVLQGDPSAA